MSTLLITGGAGFIGANLVNRALETTAHHVVVVDKVTYASSLLAVDALERHPRVTFIPCRHRRRGHDGPGLRRSIGRWP
jgi:dTDP-glucose 4,6-dehydratase